MRFLLTLFVVVPFVELVLLIALGQWMGFWNTVLLILVTGITGAFFAKREGFRALREVQTAIGKGEAPERALVSGLLLLVGGAFLVTPGLLTDIAGLLCLVPASRNWLADKALARVTQQVTQTTSNGAFFRYSTAYGVPKRGNPGKRPRRTRAGGPVIIEAQGEETFRSAN